MQLTGENIIKLTPTDEQVVLAVSGTALTLSIWAGSLAVCPVSVKVFITIYEV